MNELRRGVECVSSGRRLKAEEKRDSTFKEEEGDEEEEEEEGEEGEAEEEEDEEEEW